VRRSLIVDTHASSCYFRASVAARERDEVQGYLRQVGSLPEGRSGARGAEAGASCLR